MQGEFAHFLLSATDSLIAQFELDHHSVRMNDGMRQALVSLGRTLDYDLRRDSP